MGGSTVVTIATLHFFIPNVFFTVSLTLYQTHVNMLNKVDESVPQIVSFDEKYKTGFGMIIWHRIVYKLVFHCKKVKKM